MNDPLWEGNLNALLPESTVDLEAEFAGDAPPQGHLTGETAQFEVEATRTEIHEQNEGRRISRHLIIRLGNLDQNVTDAALIRSVRHTDGDIDPAPRRSL